MVWQATNIWWLPVKHVQDAAIHWVGCKNNLYSQETNHIEEKMNVSPGLFDFLG